MSKRIALYRVYRAWMLGEWFEIQGRYEFSGTGRELYRAMILAQRYMPKGYVEVSAWDFLDDLKAYGMEGEWIARDVES